MKLRVLLLFLYVAVSVLLFSTFKADVSVWVSFFLNFCVLSLITFYYLFVEKRYTPFIASYIVFSYLFFLIAPIIQIGSFTKKVFLFSQNFPYQTDLTIKTNVFIILFHIVFFVFYLYFKRNLSTKINTFQKPILDAVTPITIFALSIITFAVFFISYDFVIEEFSRASWQPMNYSISEFLLYKKVLFLVPFGGIILCVYYFKNTKKLSYNTLYIFCMFLFLLVMLFWFKNPLTEKRNALGPIYISLIFIFIPQILNSNTKILSFLFFSMIVLFPLVQIFTHVEYTLQEVFQNPSHLTEEFSLENFSTTFNTLNYDAFANVSASIEYVSTNGLAFGYQLLSGLLFFVPRSIWESKPIPSGQLIGNYLIDEYDFNFNNLSNPLVSEGYLNFGLIGVISMAIALAYFIVKLIIWLHQTDELKRMMAFYFAIHLIFFLRGDFASGTAYYIGTLIGVLVIPKMIHKTLKYVIKHG